jgi:hypothetical protein
MACFKHGSTVDLAVRESLALHDIKGTTLRVTRGSVWITQENDLQDIVLRAGDTWVVERDGLTILEAQENTTFYAPGREFETAVSLRPAASPTSRALWQGLRAMAAAFFNLPTRNAVPYV